MHREHNVRSNLCGLCSASFNLEPFDTVQLNVLVANWIFPSIFPLCSGQFSSRPPPPPVAWGAYFSADARAVELSALYLGFLLKSYFQSPLMFEYHANSLHLNIYIFEKYLSQNTLSRKPRFYVWKLDCHLYTIQSALVFCMSGWQFLDAVGAVLPPWRRSPFLCLYCNGIILSSVDHLDF